MRQLLRIIDKISEIGGMIGAPLPFIAALFICYEIILRFLFNLPTIWSSEATVMLVAVCYLMGGAWNLKHDHHVRVDVIYYRFSPRGQAVLNCIGALFFFLYIGFMLAAMWPYVMQSIHLREHSQTAWNPPVWPLKLIMFVSFVMVFMQGLAKFCRDLAFIIRGRES
jgi:TRAP-type mannitol/chloroaromatic compound transport system, small permease component